MSETAANSAEKTMDESLAHQLCFFRRRDNIHSISTVNNTGKSLMASFQALLLIPKGCSCSQQTVTEDDKESNQ